MASSSTFPAVMIGGPPHSGKSVLVYALSRALRAANTTHYVLRACPDGEGDWSHETPEERVRLLRQKGQFSSEFVERVRRDIERRHLPLLVDVGGKPTLEQEQILRACTHAVLLAATPEGLAEWRERAERCGLIIIAELQSVLHGDDRVDEKIPVLRGVISKLERQHPPHSLMVQTLSERLRHLFAFSPEELKERLFPRAPTEFIVDLDRLAHTAGTTHWQPSDLSRILREIPLTTCSIYGRGPNWLYAALALHIAPEPVFLFNPLLGWVCPPSVVLGEQPSDLLQWKLQTTPTFMWLEANSTQAYLDYDEMQQLVAPALDPQRGVVLSGKLPHWLLIGLALAYRQHPWIAVVQAQQYDNGIVVWSRDPQYPIGSLVPLSSFP